MRRIVQCLLAVAVMSISTSAVGDELDDFVIIGNDLLTFSPSLSRQNFAVAGPRVFVVGSTAPLDPFMRDAAIVAVDRHHRREVWRVVVGEPAHREAYDVVAADSGRLCAVGTGAISIQPPTLLLIGCYDAASGMPL